MSGFSKSEAPKQGHVKKFKIHKIAGKDTTCSNHPKLKKN